MEESSKPLIQRGSCACACGGRGARGVGDVVRRGGTEELVVDLEKGQQGHRHQEEDPPPATVADSRLAMNKEIEIAADKAFRCILRVRSNVDCIALVNFLGMYCFIQELAHEIDRGM